MSVVLVVVLSDTHIPSRGKTLPASGWSVVADADLILHAGDVCEASLLDDLSEWAPTHVAIGNCDPPEVIAWGADDVVQLTLDGVNVVMLHDTGRTEGRGRRMRERFPDADVVVFGHSHMPLIERHEGLLLLNPGSPLDKRRAPDHTMARLRIDGGRATAELVRMDR